MEMGLTCNNQCGVEIHFDPNVRSKGGKCIPLEFDGKPHMCVKSSFYKKKELTNRVSFDYINGFLTYGNFILPKVDFCKCGLYKGLLHTDSGEMVVGY